MELIFILYRPAVPGNIGAAARAIKTMGFSNLRLIDPCDHLSEEARMLAHGSNDILESAEVFKNFEEAVTDIDFLIGTTAKKRSAKEDYASPSEIQKLIYSKKDKVNKTAILFGTEESGLPNELLLECDAASSIPLRTTYPSLNLGQSVMLYAYELSELQMDKSKKADKVPEKSYAQLRERIKDLLINIDIQPDSPLHNRILERFSTIDSADINLLHSITSRLGKIINKT
ncbi:MAG: tRNA/rRNA methyltransferase [bacterium]